MSSSWGSACWGSSPRRSRSPRGAGPCPSGKQSLLWTAHAHADTLRGVRAELGRCGMLNNKQPQPQRAERGRCNHGRHKGAHLPTCSPWTCKGQSLPPRRRVSAETWAERNADNVHLQGPRAAAALGATTARQWGPHLAVQEASIELALRPVATDGRRPVPVIHGVCDETVGGTCPRARPANSYQVLSSGGTDGGHDNLHSRNSS